MSAEASTPNSSSVVTPSTDGSTDISDTSLSTFPVVSAANSSLAATPSGNSSSVTTDTAMPLMPGPSSTSLNSTGTIPAETLSSKGGSEDAKPLVVTPADRQ